MRTRGYETLRLTRSVLASAALSDAVRFLIVMKAFLKDVFEQLGFHGGGLAAKVSDFGSNLLKCSREQMGTKPAKVGHLAPGAI